MRGDQRLESARVASPCRIEPVVDVLAGGHRHTLAPRGDRTDELSTGSGSIGVRGNRWRGGDLMGAPFVWFDLTAGDGGNARRCDEELLGRTFMPRAGDYHGWMTDGEQPWAGIAPAGAVPAGRWVPYVTVDDLGTATQRARELG